MSEYRFTGPFYSDQDESAYDGGYREALNEAPVTSAEEQKIEEEPKMAEEPKSVEEPYVAEEPKFTEEPKTAKAPKQPEKKKAGFGKTVLKTICLALIAGVVGGGAFLGVTYLGKNVLGIGKTEQTITEINKSQGTQTISATVKDSIDVSDIAEKCMPSVVSITTQGVQEIRSWFGTYQQPTSGSGSGIIIGENDTELLIVTNHHVVADSTELSVYFSFDENAETSEGEAENVVSAKIKGYDSQKDLAVISVKLSDIPNDAKKQIVIASIGDSSTLKVGEQVVAIGNALGYGQSVTTGIISALNREVTLTATNGETISNQLIQTDAAINPGNSGGALLNMKGEVVGINSAKLAAQEVEGIGYAIPITAVESIIGDLMNKETRDKVDSEKAGYLGIECLSVTSDVAAAYDLPMGCYVKSVVKGSAAEKAGIQAGDVIVKLDGSSIASDTELVEGLKYYEAGEEVEIVVKTRESGYEEQTFTVVLGSRKAAGID